MNSKKSYLPTNGDSSLTDSTSTVATLPSEVHCPENEAIFDALVSRVVNETIFRKKQFIILEKELDVNSKLAVKCLQALKMEKGNWNKIKNTIRKKLNRRRNNAQLSVRWSLIRK